MLGASSPVDITFDGLLVVMVMAVVIPLALGLFPRLPLPGSVVEILAGIIIGPAVLGWVSPDRAIQVLAKLGVAFLLFLAGLELDFDRLRGRPLQFGLVGFGASIILGLAVTIPLGLTDVVIDPLLVTIILSATSLGIVMPVLKDAEHGHDPARHPGHRVLLGRGVRRDRAAVDVLLGQRGAPSDPDRREARRAGAHRGGHRVGGRTRRTGGTGSTTPSPSSRTPARRSASASRSWPSSRSWC